MKIIYNITQGFCRELAKRARKGRVAGISFAIFAALAVTLYAQSRGTPSTLRIKIDSTGALAVSSAAISNPITTVVFNNALLKVDANGYLVVTDGSGAGFAPANATYILKTANASLTNAQSLGVLNTGLLLNTKVGTTGTLSQYAGATCTNQFIRVLSSLGAATCASVSLTADISGVLPVTNGGTNISSYAIGDILYASASGVLSKLADVATGSVLVSGGVGVAPSYSANPTVTGSICSTNIIANTCDPAGWGTSARLNILDSSRAVFQIVTTAADASLTPIGVIDWVATSNTGGYNELAQLYVYTVGATALNRGGQFRFYAKVNGANSEPELMRIDGSGAETAEVTVFNPNSKTNVLDVAGGINISNGGKLSLGGNTLTSGSTWLTGANGTLAVANVGANSCGTTAATIAGNNNLFTVTVGATSGTQCRVTFTVTAGTAWGMVCADDTTTVAVRTTAVDTTHADAIGTFTAGDQITCVAFPR